MTKCLSLVFIDPWFYVMEDPVSHNQGRIFNVSVLKLIINNSTFSLSFMLSQLEETSLKYEGFFLITYVVGSGMCVDCDNIMWEG